MGSAQRPISSAFVFQHWENRSRQESEVAHTSARAYLCRCAPGQPSPNLRIITCVQFSRCVSRQIDLAFSVAMAGYCGFATPVPPHAGQVVTWGSLSRGRFGNRPSGVSSHDICPPPWQIGHWRISSSAIQRCGGFFQKDLALQTNPIICDSIVAHYILQLLRKIHKSGLTPPGASPLQTRSCNGSVMSIVSNIECNGPNQRRVARLRSPNRRWPEFEVSVFAQDVTTFGSQGHDPCRPREPAKRRFSRGRYLSSRRSTRTLHSIVPPRTPGHRQ